MATSGTTSFDLNIDDIIEEAYERCGVRTNSGYDLKSARRSLNLLFSEFANRGINYWTITQNTLTLANGTSNYTLPVGTIDILDAVIREDDIDQIVNRITIQEYNQIPNKTDTGKPSQYMLDRQYTPVIYFWNVPDKAYTLNYWVMNQIEDITASNQDTDVPYRWTDTICAGLASKLAVKYQPEKFQVLNEMYERSFNFAASSDNDGVSLRVQPTALNLM